MKFLLVLLCLTLVGAAHQEVFVRTWLSDHCPELSRFTQVSTCVFELVVPLSSDPLGFTLGESYAGSRDLATQFISSPVTRTSLALQFRDQTEELLSLARKCSCNLQGTAVRYCDGSVSLVSLENVSDGIPEVRGLENLLTLWTEIALHHTDSVQFWVVPPFVGNGYSDLLNRVQVENIHCILSEASCSSVQLADYLASKLSIRWHSDNRLGGLRDCLLGDFSTFQERYAITRESLDQKVRIPRDCFRPLIIASASSIRSILYLDLEPGNFVLLQKDGIVQVDLLSEEAPPVKERPQGQRLDIAGYNVQKLCPSVRIVPAGYDRSVQLNSPDGLEKFLTFSGPCSNNEVRHSVLASTLFNQTSSLVSALSTCPLTFPDGALLFEIDSSTGKTSVSLSKIETMKFGPKNNFSPFLDELEKIVLKGINRTVRYNPPRRVTDITIQDIQALRLMNFGTILDMKYRHLTGRGSSLLEVGESRCPGICIDNSPYTCHLGSL
jgi:hypothetical protein